MKVKTYWIVSGVIILIFGVLLLWPFKKEESKEVKKNDNIFEPSPDFYMYSPTSIIWNISQTGEYNNVDAYLTNSKTFDEESKNNIKKIVAGVEMSGKEMFSFDDNLSKYVYSKNLTSKEEVAKGDKTPEEIKTLFFETLSKYNEPSSEVSIEEVKPKKYLYPWWVSTIGTTDTDAYEILANHTFRNIPIKTFSGYLIKADYFTNGELVKLEEKFPFKSIIKSQSKTLSTIDEIKYRDVSQFKIWRVDGGQKYELSDETPKIENTAVDSYRLEYIYDVKSGVVWPYYFFRGISNLSTGEAKIILITSAVKE